jgi:hypothetical protein
MDALILDMLLAAIRLAAFAVLTAGLAVAVYRLRGTGK